jgi:ATP-binding cassette subfamily C protein
MRKIIAIFFNPPGTHPVFVLFCLLVAGISQAVGVSTLLPLISALSAGGGIDTALSRSLTSAFSYVGVTPGIASLILIAMGLLVLKSVIAFAGLSYAGVSAAKVSISFRQRLIDALFGANWKLFADQQAGKFATIISSDAGRAGDAYLFAAQVVSQAIQGLLYCIVALLIDWRLALIGLCACAILGLAMRRVIRAAKRAGYRQTDRTSELTVFMVDMLANLKPLKAMQRGQAMQLAIDGLLRRLKKAVVTRELAKAGLGEGNDALIAVFAGIGLYLTTQLTSLTLPEIVVSSVIFLQLVTIVSKLQKLVQQSAVVESAYQRTDELVRLIEASQESNSGTRAPPLDASINFEGVSFSHGNQRVIDTASFEVPQLEVTVLFGPSGAGKTTIIDLLIGLHQPSGGRITIGGVPLQEIDLRAWRSVIGYVPQELNLFHTSIRDNITLGDASVPDEKVLAAITKAGASGFVARLPKGMHTTVGELGSKMSGGQRQRISLARALLFNPKILILDEVTSALDPKTEKEIVENIRALSGKYTIIAITHRPAWTTIAGRLYQVAGGRVQQASLAAVAGH